MLIETDLYIKARRPSRLCSTWHIHGAVRPRPPDAQLPVVVVAPALDPATRLDDARVAVPQGNGGGGDTWVRGESLRERESDTKIKR
jgi:hypothetical protein